MENNISISVNIIAKNEADKIANAINSVANLANEIIVIDTGSEDDTPAICTRLGCEVYFHKWSDNFSDARNIALEYSSCDWILVLDADETVNFSYQDLPHDIMNNRQYGGVNLIIRNYIDEKNDSLQSKHRYTRLFRRDDRIRFQGRIHEQIRESIESFYDIYESDLELLHFGYKHIDKVKLERNATLLEKDLAEETDDWKIYHLAETKFAARDTIAAQQNFESIINSSELSEAQSDMVRTRLGQIYLGNDEYSRAQTILNFVSSDYDTEGLRQYVLAAVHLSIGNVSDALELYNSDAVAQSSLIDPNQLQMAKEGAEKYKSIIGK